jgi:DNA repair protein RadD
VSFELRPYQQRGVDQIRASYISGKRAPLYVLPTGGGKTAIFSYISQQAELRKKSSLILVHRHELLTQASDALTNLDVPHGLISPKFIQSFHACQIGSVQTVVRRLDRIKSPNLIIIDEAHHATSSTYRKILSAFPEALVLGVTATPVRTDGTGLGKISGGIFDDLIIGPSISELIELKYLARPTLFAPPIGIDTSEVGKLAGDFNKKQLSEFTDKPSITGSAVEHYLKHARGEPAIAFCVSVEHAKHVAGEFLSRGVRACHVDGGMNSQDRKAALSGFAGGDIEVITSADLISEGTDIPRCSVAILLRATYSEGLFLQQCGRALRPFPGKERALILDHVGNWARHGFPDDDREWSLVGVEKRGGKKDMDEMTRIAQCASCYFIYEAGPQVCPACGAESPPIKKREIKQTEGELEEIKREEVEKKRMARQQQGKAKTLEELIAIGKSKGYANPKYWAQRVFKGRKRA